MEDLAPLPGVVPDRCRHHRGGKYQLLGVVRDSQTLQTMVLYRPLYGDGGDWVRPYAMFFEDVVAGGVRQPRFAHIGDQL